jgi:hypothetical protein
MKTILKNKKNKIRGATGSDEPWPAEQPALAVFPDHQTVLG